MCLTQTRVNVVITIFVYFDHFLTKLLAILAVLGVEKVIVAAYFI
jgi:hypothetical protein